MILVKRGQIYFWLIIGVNFGMKNQDQKSNGGEACNIAIQNDRGTILYSFQLVNCLEKNNTLPGSTIIFRCFHFSVNGY